MEIVINNKKIPNNYKAKEKQIYNFIISLKNVNITQESISTLNITMLHLKPLIKPNLLPAINPFIPSTKKHKQEV
jgi:hypothetical protein